MTETSGGRAAVPSSPRMPALLPVALYVGLPAAAIAALSLHGSLSAPRVAGFLPGASLDLSYSFLRMLAAYGLSLAFSLAYGYYAATHRGGERVMIPVLDVLQSVPILGFFPIVIVVFVNLTRPARSSARTSRRCS